MTGAVLILFMLGVGFLVGGLITIFRSSTPKSTAKRCDWTCPKCNCKIDKWMQGEHPPEHCHSCGYDLRASRCSLRMRLWRRSYPELDLFLPHERSLAMERTTNTLRYLLSMALSMAAILIQADIAGAQLIQIMYSALPLPRWVVWVIMALIGVGFMFCGEWLIRGRVRRNLRQQLIDAGFAICERCGYDLRASKDRCPECGVRFERPKPNSDC